ncbi:2-oxoadipate dioxygenase/decarboxylase [Specibacter sp. RAF43]|uniref:2-oxoadipate dioxygenase/decarboxylase n=1 Tax=Specibacter sp. RAF43 TaxID=3233057 RepID=UPI003F966FE8
MTKISTTELRARFARSLSELYGKEVPAYRELVEVAQEVNAAVIAERGNDAERLGSIERVTAERHGAIRVGTPGELAQVTRIFAAFGMYPTGFYDLRDAQPNPVPVISTAFRPVDRQELAINPFRVFTSMLVPQDRRFFDEEVEARLVAFLESRTLFPDELLDLADRAEADGGMDEMAADRLIELATGAFELSVDPVDRAWYETLHSISSVAADIGGVGSTHINHLTPRVLDIDALYARMQARGIEMIDQIQGPPRWDGPDVLLRQTSFRALAEARNFREVDGTVASGDLRVRFGEVEARGIALTPAGRQLYDQLMIEIDAATAAGPGTTRQQHAARVWEQSLPTTEHDLAIRDLAFFTFHVAPDLPEGPPPGHRLVDLLENGWITAKPIVYEDFLPRSAAGIFASNLSSDGLVDLSQGEAVRDITWMAEVIGREVHVPEELYARERARSLELVATELGLRQGIEMPTASTMCGEVPGRLP